MPLHCVIVDDSAFVRQMTSKIIEEIGHKVVGNYDNGVSFLRDLPGLSPDIVFLDLILPSISGIEVMREAIKIKNDLKIIILSGMSQSGAVSAALQEGAVDFISKPVSRERLNKLLSKFTEDSIIPNVEELSTIGVACNLVSLFFEEILAHSSTSLKELIRNQAQSILEFYLQEAQGMLIIDVNNLEIKLDPDIWGNYSEEQVFKLLAKIPSDLKYELEFMHQKEVIHNLFSQTVMTMLSKSKNAKMFAIVPPEKIGLPKAGKLTPYQESILKTAATTFDELDHNISIALFVIDEMGPRVLVHQNPDMLSETDVMKNSIFYYTLISQANITQSLYGPLPATSENENISSLIFSFKGKSRDDDTDKVLLLCIFYTDVAESLVSDYKRISFIIKSRINQIRYIEDFDKSLLRYLSNDIIEYLLDN